MIIAPLPDGSLARHALSMCRAVGEPLRGHTSSVDSVAVGTLPDGTPVIVSSGDHDKNGTVRVWRLAEGTLAGEPLHGHTSWVDAVAAGTLPDDTPVIISGYGDGTVGVWRLADGTPAGDPVTGHDGPVRAVAIGELPDDTPVIISGSDDRTVRVWRLADGTPVGEPLRGHDGPVRAVAVGELPDGTPVIISGGEDHAVRVWRLADGTPVRGATARPYQHGEGGGRRGTAGWNPGHRRRLRRLGLLHSAGWRLADGTPVGEPLTGRDGPVYAVAVGALPDGTSVMISGDGAVRVWRLADGTLLVPPLNLPESIRGIALYRNVIITATAAGIAVHQPALPRPIS